jgi:hypothetical protein
MAPHRRKKPSGQIRRSQLLTSFGPGSMVDLPTQSVLIGGLDSWSVGGEEIHERRLIDKLKNLFDPPLLSLRLLSPPPDNTDPNAPQTGITCWQFPEWFITQDVASDNGGYVRTRRLLHRRSLVNGEFVDDNRKSKRVVPVRFVRACRYGHIGDIDWYGFVHNRENNDCRLPLWIDEFGTSGDITEVQIRCECGARRGLYEAAASQNQPLGFCDGNRPWLGDYSRERCDQPNRFLIRQASNSYFPQLMTAISLPNRNEELREAVGNVWDFVEEVADFEGLKHERKKSKVSSALQGFTDEQVLGEILTRRGIQTAPEKSLKQVEFETLTAAEDDLGDDKPDGDFYARTLPPKVWNGQWMAPVERVVLVHRMREVMAQVGFTRFEPVSPDIDGELEIGVRQAHLAREVTWLPAVENRGEGIFIQFRRELVEAWLARKDVINHGLRLAEGYIAWKSEHHGASKKFAEAGGILPYTLFHTFSHLLLTSVSLECGYPASSIRERIYCLPNVGYGVLLFTGTPDAEGTLGGLVQVGRRIQEHVRSALIMGELCSNDPVCAQHDPANLHERRFLHGAACHGCLLISETSCEHFNEFLDRSLVVPTVENRGIEFFKLEG